MTLVIQVAAGVALAPFVFLLGALVLRACCALASRGWWEDHPNVSIALVCGVLALALGAAR